ncbi:MAG: hypothetical protein HY319_16995 [Armatimonadetes bacterium]|nr:hypothetical protein [Armatimonadota bacterium]
MVRVTHYERDPVNGPGQMVTESARRLGRSFVVFCSNQDCEHYWDRPSAIPHWTDDCPELLGVLRCPVCRSPVVRPQGPD